MEHLLNKRRIVRQHARRIVVNIETSRHRFDVLVASGRLR